MNGLTFGETPSLRNTPGSFWADERPGGALHEETQAEASRRLVVEMIEMTREDARFSFTLGGITAAELDQFEALASAWGLK